MPVRFAMPNRLLSLLYPNPFLQAARDGLPRLRQS
jgi:hypothetical protein